MNLDTCLCQYCNAFVYGQQYCPLGIPPITWIAIAFIILLILLWFYDELKRWKEKLQDSGVSAKGIYKEK